MAKSFAYIGGMYATVECAVEGYRGKHDIKNHVLTGCVTGAGLAYNQGPLAIAGGCLGFAAFGIVIEQVMH